MGACSGSGFGLRLHHIGRRVFAEFAISVCASLVVTAILASSSPNWPRVATTVGKLTLNAPVDADPQLESFIESVALAHVGPQRDHRAARPLRNSAPIVASQAAASPLPQRRVRPEARRPVAPPSPPARPAGLSLPVSAPPIPATTSPLQKGALILSRLVKAIPFHGPIIARADSIGAAVSGLVERIQ